MPADNREAYEIVSWILDNADMGLFIVTAPHNMQRDIAERYMTAKTAIYDYALKPSPFSYPELNVWTEEHRDADFYFILNMQLALRDENDMLSFNMSRDILAKKNKAWLFFMTKDLDNRLSTFAYDMYSFIRLKAHFLPEYDDDLDGRRRLEYADIDQFVDVKKAREALERYKDLEKELIVLAEKGASDNRLIAAATTLSNIAKLYKNCADYANAIRLYEIVKNIRENIKGEWHPDTGETYNNIANIYNDLGEYAKALELLVKALAILEKTLGIEHPDTAKAYNNIAIIYNEQGDYTKALDLFKKALVIKEKTLGIEHPDTARAYNNISIVYVNLGDYAKALELFEKALEIREKTLGIEHPDTASSYYNIAYVYNEKSDYTKALELYKKALAIYEKMLGMEHPDTARVYNNIAYVYGEQGDYTKAQEFLEKALAIYLKTFGQNHPSTIANQRNLDNLRTRIPGSAPSSSPE